MPVDRSHDQRNEHERARLAAFVDLPESDLTRDLGGGWTVATALAHTAFWDRFAHERLRLWLRDGSPISVQRPVVDALNDALIHQWTDLPPRAAAAGALAAAEAIDEEIRRLSDEVVERYRGSLAPGQAPLFLDRTAHRMEHSSQIEAALDNRRDSR
jgi:hypothetical protein